MYTSPDYAFYKQAAKPEAYITVNRNRIKSYNGNAYLSNKQEFEIELFNPKTTPVLAKISINGKEISQGGFVVKPGQRIYLERFFDSPKKFLFETYNVDNTAEAVLAIAKNGDIEIKFYDEYTLPSVTYNTDLLLGSGTRSGYYDGTINNAYYASVTSTSNLSSGSLRLSNNLSSFGSKVLHKTASANTDSIETGRIEQGSKSNQSFVNYNGKFVSYTCATFSYKLLPYSAKPLEAKDLAVYCTNCGTKNKKNSYKFCPKCGTRFE